MTYENPKYEKIASTVNEYFNHDFNFLKYDVVNKIFDDSVYDNIVNPSFKIIMEECMEDSTEADDWLKEYCRITSRNIKGVTIKHEGFCEWVKDFKYSDVMELWQETEHYPMWNTLYEAKDKYLGDKLLNSVDELYKIQIGVMQGGEDLNTLLFIPGAGYDFYQAHWVPLYTEVLKAGIGD